MRNLLPPIVAEADEKAVEKAIASMQVLRQHAGGVARDLREPRTHSTRRKPGAAARRMRRRHRNGVPSTSKVQAKTMRAAAHSPAFAEKVGIPPSVAKDYVAADKKRGTKRLPERKK